MEIPVTFEVKEGAAEETDDADMMDGEMDGGRKMELENDGRYSNCSTGVRNSVD